MTAERRFVAPGGSVQASATLTNRSSRTIEDARVRLTVPPGWSARPACGARWRELAPGTSRTATWLVRGPADADPGAVAHLKALGAYTAGDRRIERTSAGELMIEPSPPPTGDPFLSDIDPFGSFNSLGPLERDMSSGGGAAGDGGALTIEGRTFAEGLGGHAHSEQAYHLGGRCSRLDAVVGVDDEVGPADTVVFQVGDGPSRLRDRLACL